MFEELIKKPITLERHRNAPFAKEREAFLAHCAQEGYSQLMLQTIAREMFWAAHNLKVNSAARISFNQIEEASKKGRYGGEELKTEACRKLFIRVTKRWLRFLDRLQEPSPKAIPFEGVINEFALWMEDERGLASSTIEVWSRHVRIFLCWYAVRKRSISAIDILDVDSYLKASSRKGWSRVTVANNMSALKTFFWFGGMQGLCSRSIADLIESPRIFTHESLPRGPAWDDVKRLFASMETDNPFDIRDRAILMLFAVYGFRASEVSNLQFENIDWDHDRIQVQRVKRRRPQMYPLAPTVGNAIAKYLKDIRPQSSRKEVFLSLLAPFRPMYRSGLYHVTKTHMLKIGINSPHYGPHSLRHACAGHLICEGFSLKEIGDHLGHRTSSATRVYAKVNLPGLRKVSKFDLGGL